MAKRKKAAIEGVLQPDENIYWQGKPEKLPFVLNEMREDFLELFLRILFDLILIPVLIANVQLEINIVATLVLIFLWILHLKPILDIIKKPTIKLLEWKNTYYIITDKNIYIQFGTNHIYYRSYSSDRIGTKVFYRENQIDSTLFVGTIGFSVDDYYEERISSIKDYEDVYKILRSFASVKKVQLQEELEREKLRQDELLRQQELLKQSEELRQQSRQEVETNEYEFESYDSYKKRMQEEELQEKYSKEEEEKQREREHEELINKYNEYRKRHEAAKQKEQKTEVTKNEDGTSVTLKYNTADDSGIEDGAEIEFPVNVPRPPKKNKKGKTPKRSNRVDPTKNKPPVQFGSVNGEKPKNITDNNAKDTGGEDIDMSVLWGGFVDTENND